MKPELKFENLPAVSASDPAWLQHCLRFAKKHQEFRLIHVATPTQIEQAVDFIVQNRMWIEECVGGYAVTFL